MFISCLNHWIFSFSMGLLSTRKLDWCSYYCNFRCPHVPPCAQDSPQIPTEFRFWSHGSKLGPLTGPGLARTRSKCSTHRPSWAAGRASGAETSHVEIRHFTQLHFAQNFLTFQTQHLELTYIWICPKLGTQNGHISGENDWGFGAPYQTDPSVNCIQLSHLAAAFDPSAQGRTNMSHCATYGLAVRDSSRTWV